MKKKIILAIVALVAVSLGVVGMSAFEAHIINVTAHIENALTVPVEANGMSFGTVFPEEVSFQNMDIQLSSSFLATDRVDDIEYMIRQKPKCGVPLPNTDPVQYSSYPQVTENDDGRFICPDGSVMLPLLCPYLSKHEVGTTIGIDAFHGPLTNWTMADTLATQVTGRLSKADNKTSTAWVIDLHAPCFKGMCAQDNVIPDAYQYDPAFEGQLFGCDLWVEVTGLSTSTQQGNLTVTKIVEGGGPKVAADFPLFVDGSAVTSGVGITTTAGNHTITETADPDYVVNFGANCPGGIVNVPANGDASCTVINTFIIQPSIMGQLTVIKQVQGNGADPNSFTLFVDGMSVTNNIATTTTAVNHVVSEIPDSNYTLTFGGDCDSGGNVIVSAVTPKTCTLINTLNDGAITVIKEVINHIDGTTTGSDNFQMEIDGSDVAQGTPIPVTANTAHTISETGPSGYTTTFSGACNGTNQVTVAPGENVTCTVTNEQRFGTITVNKTVDNGDGGTLTIGNFTLKVDTSVVASGIPKNVAPGAHTVSEVGVFGYSTTIGGDCDVAGHVTVGAGENKICTILNDDIKPSIELIKSVVGGSAEPDDFDVSIDGSIVTSGSSNAVIAGIAHVIDEETIVSGYSFTSITGVSFKGVACPALLKRTITLLPGDVVTCTITNTFGGVGGD